MEVKRLKRNVRKEKRHDFQTKLATTRTSLTEKGREHM
jgi:hypothetical protein